MKNRHTILYIGNQLAPRGGTPTSVDTLAPLLEKEGFYLITASARRNKLLRLFEMIWTLWNHRREVHLILIDTYSTSNFWYAVIIGRMAKMLKLPYFPILHGGELPVRLRSGSKLNRLFFSEATCNITPSLYLKAVFEQEGISQLQYIPNALQLEEYPFRKRPVLRPRLLWVRSFSRVYNPLLALKVLQEVLVEYPESELMMIGPEKDSSLQACRTYAKKYQLPVSFMGRRSKKEWTEISRDWDIFLNTTDADNAPVSVMEAMALGLPVVSTDVGGIPYLIQDNEEGLLVPPNQPVVMAQAIFDLLERPKKAVQFAANARKKVEAFDWNEIRGKWRSLFHNFIK